MARSGDAAGGTDPLPAYGRGRKPRDGLEGVCGSAAFVQRCFHDPAVCAAAGAAVGVAAMESAEARGGGSGAGVQHRGIVHHEHELAKLLARDHHELSHADGWSGLSQLGFGGGGHGAGHRIHSRHFAARAEDHRQFLGRPGSRHPVGAGSAVSGGRAAAGVAGRGAELEAL